MVDSFSEDLEALGITAEVPPVHQSNGAHPPTSPREAWEAGPPRDDVDEAESPSPLPMLYGSHLAEPLPDLEYLVREIAMVAGGGAPHLIAGYGFSGKTAALQSLALSLAAGVPVWGAYPVRDARRVVHVDMEQGQRLTQRRYQRLARAMGIKLAQLGDMLAVSVMPPITLCAQYESKWRELMAGRDLAFIDSLRAATGGQDENSSDIRAGLDMLGRLSEQTGCRAAMVHHARKPNDDAPGGRYMIRGSGAIYDGCDSCYLFSANKGEPVSVDQVKARSHGETIETFALVIGDVECGGDPRGGLSVMVRGGELIHERRSEQEKAVRSARTRRDAETMRTILAKNPGIGTRELRALAGMSGDRLTAAIMHMGSSVEIRTERVPGAGPRPSVRHYLRGQRAPEVGQTDPPPPETVPGTTAGTPGTPPETVPEAPALDDDDEAARWAAEQALLDDR